ncbi:hypothetical protein CISIN_1g039174mg, partial [Citrus sinensis]
PTTTFIFSFFLSSFVPFLFFSYKHVLLLLCVLLLTIIIIIIIIIIISFLFVALPSFILHLQRKTGTRKAPASAMLDLNLSVYSGEYSNSMNRESSGSFHSSVVTSVGDCCSPASSSGGYIFSILKDSNNNSGSNQNDHHHHQHHYQNDNVLTQGGGGGGGGGSSGIPFIPLIINTEVEEEEEGNNNNDDERDRVASLSQQQEVQIQQHSHSRQMKKTRRGPRSKSSQYRGVTFYRRTGRWESHIWDCGKQVYLGGFDTALAAARAYDRAAIKFRGVDADINFHVDDYQDDIRIMSNFTKDEFVYSLRRQNTAAASRGTSKYRGVTLHKCGRWEARMGQYLGRKYVYLGAIQ